MPDFSYSGLANFIFEDTFLYNHMWIALMRNFIYMDVFTIFLGLSFQTFWVLWDIISRWISDDEHGERFSTCIMEILDEWIHPVFIKYFLVFIGIFYKFYGYYF